MTNAHPHMARAMNQDEIASREAELTELGEEILERFADSPEYYAPDPHEAGQLPEIINGQASVKMVRHNQDGSIEKRLTLWFELEES